MTGVLLKFKKYLWRPAIVFYCKIVAQLAEFLWMVESCSQWKLMIHFIFRILFWYTGASFITISTKILRTYWYPTREPGHGGPSLSSDSRTSWLVHPPEAASEWPAKGNAIVGGSLSSLRQMFTEGTLVLKTQSPRWFFYYPDCGENGTKTMNKFERDFKWDPFRKYLLLVVPNNLAITPYSTLMSFDFNCNKNMICPKQLQ